MQQFPRGSAKGKPWAMPRPKIPLNRRRSAVLAAGLVLSLLAMGTIVWGLFSASENAEDAYQRGLESAGTLDDE